MSLSERMLRYNEEIVRLLTERRNLEDKIGEIDYEIGVQIQKISRGTLGLSELMKKANELGLGIPANSESK